tara:strand:+ start:576 stop:776 length:201 start_codon:yes stop_codon:yes gene_type:complete
MYDLQTLFKVVEDLKLLQASALPLQWQRIGALINTYEAMAVSIEADMVARLDDQVFGKKKVDSIRA